MYYIYMLRCKDDSIYTGITTDLDRRMKEHFGAGEKSAKYTRSHVALKLEAAWQTSLLDRLVQALPVQVETLSHRFLLQCFSVLIHRNP